MSKKYNGHASWSAWNVSLWLNNDEGLYNLMRSCVRRNGNRDQAASELLCRLADCGITETPDGAKYSKSTIKAAMIGL